MPSRPFSRAAASNSSPAAGKGLGEAEHGRGREHRFEQRGGGRQRHVAQVVAIQIEQVEEK